MRKSAGRPIADFGLPVYDPYLTVTAGEPGIAVGAEDEICLFNMYGNRISHWPLPSMDSGIRHCGPVNAPLHEERLARLGIHQMGVGGHIRTGYLRFAIDTEKPIRAGWGDVDGFCLLAGQLLSMRQSEAVQP